MAECPPGPTRSHCLLIHKASATTSDAAVVSEAEAKSCAAEVRAQMMREQATRCRWCVYLQLLQHGTAGGQSVWLVLRTDLSTD